MKYRNRPTWYGDGRACITQIRFAECNKLGLVARQIDDCDVPRANLVLGQLRSRNLPVPAAIFAERLVRVLEGMRSESRSAANTR